VTDLLREEFPVLLEKIDKQETLFPAFTGETPEGKRYEAPFARDGQTGLLEECREVMAKDSGAELTMWPTTWQVSWDDEHLYVTVFCQTREPAEAERITVSLEPRRLWPGLHFSLGVDGWTHCECLSSRPMVDWHADVDVRATEWKGKFTIPFSVLGERNPVKERLRINVARTLENGTVISWMPIRRLAPRICLGTYNPADYGWLFLKKLG
jgi:hypothetical protein